MNIPTIKRSHFVLAGSTVVGFAVLATIGRGDLPDPPEELEEIKSPHYLAQEKTTGKYTRYSYRFEEGREEFVTDYYLSELRSRGWKIERDHVDDLSNCFGCDADLSSGKRRTILALKGAKSLLIRVSYGSRIDITMETSPIRQASSTNWL